MASVAGNWFWLVSLTRHFTGFPPVYLEGRPLLEEAISPFTHGVPQGVILVIIFRLHASFSRYHSFFGISYYFYADDIQVYVALKSDELDRL